VPLHMMSILEGSVGSKPDTKARFLSPKAGHYNHPFSRSRCAKALSK
jgi:hypothetical protein